MALRIWKYLTIFFCLAILSNCQESIAFEKPETIKETINIQGKLTKGSPSQIEVKIQQVFNFIESPSLFFADYVHLIDEEENVVVLKSRAQGIFKLDIPADHPTFKIDYGKAYKIKLQLRNGSTYESAYDTLYQVPTPTDLTLDKISKKVIFLDGKSETQELVTFNISTPLISKNGTKPHLLWELQSVYKQTDYPTGIFGLTRCPITGPPKICYLTVNPVDNYKVLNAPSLTGSEIVNHTIFEAGNTNTFVFSEGHYLTVYQQAVSKQTYDYWERVGDVVRREGSAFDSPAGKIVSNIKNLDRSEEDVFGYFFVTESKLIRAYVSPDYAGNPRPQCPGAVDMHSVFCDNCLCESNATTEKPDYWEE